MLKKISSQDIAIGDLTTMKWLTRFIILTLFLLVLLMPIFLLSQDSSIRKPADALFLIQRALGLYAFSLIFIAMVMGSAMSLLGDLFPADKVFNTHQLVGKLAFSLALLHPIFLYSTYLPERNLNYILPFQTGINSLYYYLGILAFGLMTLTVGAAILRFRIGPKWIYIHRLNYVIFWLIFFHSLNLGVDVQTKPAQLLYLTYGVVVGILTIRRIIYFLS